MCTTSTFLIISVCVALPTHSRHWRGGDIANRNLDRRSDPRTGLTRGRRQRPAAIHKLLLFKRFSGGDGRVNSPRQHSISRGFAPIPPFFPRHRGRRLHPCALSPDGDRAVRVVQRTSVPIRAWHVEALPPRHPRRVSPLFPRVRRVRGRGPSAEAPVRTESPAR